MVSEAAQVRQDAKAILIEAGDTEDGVATKLKGKSTTEIKKLVIGALNGGLRLDGKDESFVSTAYETMIASRSASGDSVQRQAPMIPVLGNLMQQQPPAVRLDAKGAPVVDPGDANAARARMLERNQKAWQDADAS